VKPKTALEQGMTGLRTVILVCCIVCDEAHTLLCEIKSNSIKDEAMEDVRFVSKLAQKFTFQNL
jgi:hypothetical protein